MNQFIVYSVEKNYRSLFTRRIFWKLEYITRAQTHGRGRDSGTDKRNPQPPEAGGAKEWILEPLGAMGPHRHLHFGLLTSDF